MDDHKHITGEQPTEFPTVGPRRWISVYTGNAPASVLVTSLWLAPATLYAVRAILAVWTTVWLVITLFFSGFDGWHVLSYFTILSYIGIFLYSLLVCGLSAQYWRDPQSQILAEKTGQHVTAVVLYTTALVNCIVVSGVYWYMLAPLGPLEPASTLLGLDNYVIHVANICVMVVHFATSAITVPSVALVLPVLVEGALYVAWAQVYFAITGYWVYPFLSPDYPDSGMMYAAVFVASAALTLLWRVLHVVRGWALGGPAFRSHRIGVDQS
ncbi:hypothetical protein BC828DRAFT_383614 [Blastocladiella britannica]|nr:hypothetical protein BC828DRAFT_383614 [Blastocladiella britannica]